MGKKRKKGKSKNRYVANPTANNNSGGASTKFSIGFRRCRSEDVQRIADEVFGGRYYCVGTNNNIEINS